MTKGENAVFALLIGLSALAAEEASARDRDSDGRLLDEPRGGLYREPSQDIRQERKSLRQDFGARFKSVHGIAVSGGDMYARAERRAGVSR